MTRVPFPGTRLVVGLVGLLATAFPLLAQPEVVTGYYPGDSALWERAFVGRGPAFTQPEGTVVAAVVPHHDIEVFTLGDYYRSLADRIQPPVIALVAPNHFEVGTTPLVLAGTVEYSTMEGLLQVDRPLTQALLARMGPQASVLAGVWGAEHGVFMHAPYLKHFFPGARFLPVLIRMDAGTKDTETLAVALDGLLPPGSLVVASVDFSHYQIETVARYHDEATATALGRGDSESLMTKEVDSPQSLDTARRFAELRASRTWVQVARTTAASYSRDPQSETTSHLYWTAVTGPPIQPPRITLVAGGRSDLTLGIRWAWPWDRHRRNTDPQVARLRGLAGKEARFLGGFDLYLLAEVPGWTEGTAGGMKVAIGGWEEGRSFEEQRREISTKAAEGAWVAVTRTPPAAGSGAEPWTTAQVDLLVEAGAKLVVQRTKGTSAGPALRQGALWVAGLGDLATGGNTSQGRILLASWSAGTWLFETLPVEVRDGRPQPVFQFGDLFEGESVVRP